MNTEELALRLVGVKKQYRLGSINGSTLKAELQSWWARRHGREDPNLKIGQASANGRKSFLALDGIDLTVKRGERLGIIGLNGAGKSTLLKLISRITAPTEGQIDIWGRVSSLLEVGTGFHREMTGRENIFMNGTILGMSREEIQERMEQIIDFSELREFIDTPVKRYSSGMFVKLAFSVAAHLSSEILIMDEVLAVGDLSFQQKCLARMRQAADEEGRTVLYVSHNLNTIRQLCDRCIVLDHGKIVFDGEPETAIASYLDLCLGKDEIDMDLSSKSHQNSVHDVAVLMSHLQLSDKLSPVFEPSESLRFSLLIKVKKPVTEVSFRLTLRTDGDVPLGTAWSRSFDLPIIGDHELQMELPLDGVAKGVFYASIGLYRTDELGRKLMLDHITRAFKLEVLGAPAWNTSAYGYLYLPEIRSSFIPQ